MKNLAKCFLIIAAFTLLTFGIRSYVSDNVKAEVDEGTSTKKSVTLEESTSAGKENSTSGTNVESTTVKGAFTENSNAERTTDNSLTTTKKATTTVAPTVPKSEYVVEGFEDEMLSRINALRSEAGVSPVSIDSSLMSLSRQRAQELSIRYRSDHVRPDDSDWSTILNSYSGAWATAGENIAFGQTSCKEIMEDWAASPAHYQNIIKADYQFVGFGCYSRNGVLYWDQIFLGT